MLYCRHNVYSKVKRLVERIGRGEHVKKDAPFVPIRRSAVYIRPRTSSPQKRRTGNKRRRQRAPSNNRRRRRQRTSPSPARTSLLDSPPLLSQAVKGSNT